jgi:TPR repeat protein
VAIVTQRTTSTHFTAFDRGLSNGRGMKKGEYWLRIAARKGLPMAEHNLGLDLSVSESKKDQAEASFWLKKGAKDGVPAHDVN